MQDHALQAHIQPFMKLAQSNIELISRFSTSSEVGAQATANATQFFQQATESAMKLMQSGAYAHMVQGLMKNYTEFLSDLGQSSMAMLTQGQAQWVRQAQEAGDTVAEVVQAHGRRAR